MEAIPFVALHTDEKTGETFVILRQNGGFGESSTVNMLRVSMGQFSGLMMVLKSLETNFVGQNNYQSYADFMEPTTLDMGTSNFNDYETDQVQKSDESYAPLTIEHNDTQNDGKTIVQKKESRSGKRKRMGDSRKKIDDKDNDDISLVDKVANESLEYLNVLSFFNEKGN